MLDPRSAMSGANERNSSAIASASSNAPGPKLPSDPPVPARVVRQRGHSVGPAAAREVEVALLRRAGAVEDHDAHVGLRLGQEERVGEPVVGAELRRCGRGVPHRVLHNRRSMSALAVSHVYPLGSRLNERGRLEVGGCDVLELAAEFGTPAYVYAEDDMRARARSFIEAFRARTEHFEVVYASKAFPCTAAYRLFAEEGLSADVASGGELHLALAAGMDPKRLYMHGNNKSPAELDYAIESGLGHIVVDSFDEIERLRGRGQRVLLRVTPGIEPTTHEFIQTGQVDSKFGFQMDEVERAVAACADAGLELRGLHAHIGSQILDVDVFEKLGELLAGMGDWPLLNLGGGLGIAYTADDSPPSIEEYVEALLRHAPEGVTVLCEPGRALVGNAGVTLYTVGTIKRDPGRAHLRGGGRRHVRQPAPDALRRPLRGRDRGPVRADGELVHDRRDALRVGRRPRPRRGAERPAVGDVLVIPATGAYSHAMANNYNAVPRPPVIFCRDGDARVVVRRETYEDLTLRDR